MAHFVENFGKLPETEPEPLIPSRWRIPVFAAMIVIGAVGLALFLWLVVVPAIGSQGATSKEEPAHTPAASKPIQ